MASPGAATQVTKSKKLVHTRRAHASIVMPLPVALREGERTGDNAEHQEALARQRPCRHRYGQTLNLLVNLALVNLALLLITIYG